MSDSDLNKRATDIARKNDYLSVRAELINTCPMCKAGALGLIWTRDIAIGNKTVEAAVKMFKMDADSVMLHMTKHEIKKGDKGEMWSDDFILNEMLYLFNGLKKWADYLIVTEDMSPATIGPLTKLSKELRETLTIIAELQGRLDSKTNNSQVTILEQRVQKITNVVIHGACDSCKAKILDAIEAGEVQGRKQKVIDVGKRHG